LAASSPGRGGAWPLRAAAGHLCCRSLVFASRRLQANRRKLALDGPLNHLAVMNTTTPAATAPPLPAPRDPKLRRMADALRVLAMDALSRATEGAIVAHGAEHLADELAALGVTEMGEGRSEYAASEALGAASAEMAAAAVRSAARPFCRSARKHSGASRPWCAMPTPPAPRPASVGVRLDAPAPAGPRVG